MPFIGPKPADTVINSTLIDDGTIELVDISSAAQDALGKIDYYGFKKTNGTGNQKEDLILTYTNGADNISAATNDGTQSDLYDESFFAKKGLSFTIDNDGNLKVTV
tara:strand:- start:537 stop:854 length:318 start_codon:yes stop_codon:yes gene_type:complete